MADIYTFPKPEIELTLEAGGSLTQNTTYYFGATIYGVRTGQGPLSDQYSITTTTTDLSIRVRIKYDTGGGVYTYDRPVPSFWTANYGRWRIVWNDVDMTDGAGNWVFKDYTTFDDLYVLNGTSTQYNVLYSTQPVVGTTLARWSYAPERYGYNNGGVNPLDIKGWSLTQGHPIVYATADSDTWANIISTLDADVFDGYRKSDKTSTTLEGYFSVYSAYAVEWGDLTITLYYGTFQSVGTHDRCTVSVWGYTASSGRIGGGTNFKGSNSYVRSNYYRPSLIVSGVANSISSMEGQLSIGFNDVYEKSYLNSYLLTNGLGGQANMKLYNSILYIQKLTTDQTIDGMSIYYDKDTSNYTASYRAYEILFAGHFDNTVRTLTIKNFSIDTNRPTSEGIDYITERKPRLWWNSSTSYPYIYKTLDFVNTIDVYITDEDGVAIANADVQISNGFETLTGQTDVDGYLTNEILIRRAIQDPDYGATAYTHYTIWTDEEVVDVIIAKDGYETYKSKVNLLDTDRDDIVLKNAKTLIMDVNNSLYYNLDKTNTSTSKIKLEKIN